MQRVVVTGLGAVTPLGLGAWLQDTYWTLPTLTILGVQRTWKRILDGQCGVVSLKGKQHHEQQQCQVAGLVPQGTKENGGWTASEWLTSDEQRKLSTFMQYAAVATHEALQDSGWKPETSEQQEMTVSGAIIVEPRPS